MLRPVQFNYKTGVVAIKVRDELIDDLLAKEANGISAQKVVPKMSLFSGHRFSQRFCVCR